MKKEGLYVALAPSAIWALPKLVEHFGNGVEKVRKNVVKSLSVSFTELQEYIKGLGVQEGYYDIEKGSVSKWPFSLVNAQMEKEAEMYKESSFLKILITGALKSLKVAAVMTFNFRLKSIVKELEDWVGETYK
jgi:hypothetical protein